jgi:hypothetical protein
VGDEVVLRAATANDGIANKAGLLGHGRHDHCAVALIAWVAGWRAWTPRNGYGTIGATAGQRRHRSVDRMRIAAIAKSAKSR